MKKHALIFSIIKLHKTSLLLFSILILTPGKIFALTTKTNPIIEKKPNPQIKNKLYSIAEKLDNFEIIFKELKKEKNWTALIKYLQEKTASDAQFIKKINNCVHKLGKIKLLVQDFITNVKTDVKNTETKKYFKDKATEKIITDHEELIKEIDNKINDANKVKIISSAKITKDRLEDFNQIKLLSKTFTDIKGLIESIK